MLTSNENVLAFRPAPGRPAASEQASRIPDVLLGPSPAIAHVWAQIRRVAPYFRFALITGERGSGHEAVARTLHSLSPHPSRPFTTITAADAELKLTGATLPRFQNDTVFLPDVERLSTPAQQGVLRLMRLRRPHQVWIIAASPTELRPLVSAGSFSPALASSLSALHLSLPALRERREDLPALATHLLAAEAKAQRCEPPVLAQGLLDLMLEQPWPGNLDQLQAVLRKLVEDQSPEALPRIEAILESAPEPQPALPEPERLLRLEDVVQQHIRAVLLSCNGNKLRAAELLGISRSTLYRMLDNGEVAANRLPFAV